MSNRNTTHDMFTTERVYDAAHLAKNPDQQTRSIRVLLTEYPAISGATIRRTANDRLPEEARGEYIAYDSRKEFYVMRNTPSGEDRPGAGRNIIILPPSRIAPNAGALAGKAAQ